MKSLSTCLTLLLLLLAGCAGRDVPVVDAAANQRPAPWSPAAIEAARAIPVQHEGRVKPFDTLASFTLYAVHGRRDMQFTFGSQQDKVVLTPTEWLLDVWCFPQQANQYPLFRIENDKVLDILFPDVAHAQQQNFNYLSFAALLDRPHPEAGKPEAVAPIDRLVQQVQQLTSTKETKNMELDEQALVRLHEQVMTYNTVLRACELLHPPYVSYVLKGDAVKALFDGHDHASFAEVVGKAGEVARVARELAGKPEADSSTAPAMAQELSQIAQDDGSGPALFPPSATVKEAEKWLTVPELVRLSLAGSLKRQQLDQLAALQEFLFNDNQPAREEALLRYHKLASAAAGTRGEYEKVELEAKYYVRAWSYHALHWFLPGFLCVCGSWILMTFSRKLALVTDLGAWAFTLVGLGYLTADIAVRCLITERPPIKNLYDTFLFICAIGVAAALAGEAITRRRVALSVAPFLGSVLIMLARLYEQGTDSGDTMKQLPAVLDSNYWLATHVTTINMGYAAGMVAMLLADVWLVLRAFRIGDRDPAFQKTIVRLCYGVTCFGLLFAVVGTILGGVWANDSWGRFWGWDPKENGALLICLAQVALLHGRMCGWFRDFLFCLLAGATGMWVAFSWFHVNLLGVGLHSYGFSAGLKTAVFTFYGLQGLVLLVGVVGQLVRHYGAAAAPAKGAPWPSPSADAAAH